jgi:ketosteroid isomerase-like protein
MEEGPVGEITEIVNRETKAWDTKDVDFLLSIFHPDMVWVWPKKNDQHNPIDWELPLGKFDYERWKKVYSEMFGKYKLLKNDRKIVEIKVSPEGDGAFAVVDVDTLWEDQEGKQHHWLGRAGKTYVKTGGEWKLIAHFGLLLY